MFVPTTRQTEFSEGPREITAQNVQYYCAHARELKHSQQHKAHEFIKLGCIKYAGNGVFVCENIPGYNQRAYTIQKIGKTFTCNCQGFIMKEKRGEVVEGGANCSHVGALYLALKMGKNYNLGGFEDKFDEISVRGG